MCVIISKPATIVIPPQKIESAWENNKDGFGATFVDDSGDFHVRKFIKQKPDDINKFLEEINNFDAMIHLRFNTKGETNRSNLHPFTILSKKKHGVDLQLFHNGTLNDFGDKKVSDTNEFVETIAKPLYEMVNTVEKGDLERILDNSLAQTVIDKYRGNSVFSLFSETGSWLHWGDGHDQEGGWWSSNDSYFDNPKAREPAPTKIYSYPSGGGWSESTGYIPPKKPKESKTTSQVPQVLTSVPTKTTSRPAAVGKPTLVEHDFFDDETVASLSSYSDEDLRVLVDSYPNEAVAALRTLVNTSYWHEAYAKEQGET
jgi:hypothetical protein